MEALNDETCGCHEIYCGWNRRFPVWTRTFYAQCLAFACDRLEFSLSWRFNTGSLASRPIDNLSTYYHQSTFVHGLPLSEPGIPLEMFPQVFLHTVDQILFKIFQTRNAMPIPDHILVFTKGAQNVQFLNTAVRWLQPACRYRSNIWRNCTVCQ